MEQKLSVIMAADVVGYSRLMELDEKGTLATLMVHRQELWDVGVAAHHGRIVKLIGDGMLMEFRAVEDAVRCAVEIQRGMQTRNAGTQRDRRIEFRIGINLGDILFEDGDVYGDGVNVAARIESLAKPGGISVSASVHDTLGGRLDIRFEDTGAQALKNIGRPVHIYNIVIDDGGSEGVALMAPPTQEIRENPSVKSSRTLLYVSRFANLSGNPDEEYFAAGITQDVVAALSRFSGLNVIVRLPRPEPQPQARTTYYTLEGSVRRAAHRVRVNASLTNATGEHIWAEKYDFDLVDMFDVQDELSRSIPAALNVKIEEAERYRILAEPLKGSSAYDFNLRGRHFEKNLKPDEVRRAKEMFLAAVDADPAYARGYLGLAWLDIRKLKWNERADMEATLASAFASASKALELSPCDADGRSASSICGGERQNAPSVVTSVGANWRRTIAIFLRNIAMPWGISVCWRTRSGSGNWPCD